MSRDHDHDNNLAEAMCGLTFAIAGLARTIENNNNQAILKRLAEMEQRIMATNAENVAKLTADLKTTNVQLRKLIADTFGQQATVDALKAKVAELQALVDAGGPITQELIDTAAETVALTQQVDDNIPELPGTPVNIILTQDQIAALIAASLPLTVEQVTANTAGTGPTLTAEQVAALLTAGLPVPTPPVP